MAAKMISLLIGYVFGSILTAVLVVRKKTGKSVFEVGTGNPGMANVMRQFGFKAGALVLAGDLVKTILAVLLTMVLFPGGGSILRLYTVLGCTVGHNWPLWHHLRGGKGVATTCMGIFLYSPLLGLIADVAGMLVVFSTGYLPLGAVVISSLFAVFTFLLKGTEAGILALVLAVIMFDRHFPGLVRVAKGEEKKNAQFFKRHRTSETSSH